MAEDLLQAAQDLRIAVGAGDDPVDEVGAGQVEAIPGKLIGNGMTATTWARSSLEVKSDRRSIWWPGAALG